MASHLVFYLWFMFPFFYLRFMVTPLVFYLRCMVPFFYLRFMVTPLVFKKILSDCILQEIYAAKYMYVKQDRVLNVYNLKHGGNHVYSGVSE
jgi:chromosome condensin MukBEF MukE localization factor